MNGRMETGCENDIRIYSATYEILWFGGSDGTGKDTERERAKFTLALYQHEKTRSTGQGDGADDILGRDADWRGGGNEDW